jgi:circadian clock protein KaiC
MIEERLPSGIAGLDEVLHGGLVPRRSYLVVGSAGTGKTILSMQYLREGSRRGEKGLCITLAEPAEEIERNMAGFGWRWDGIEVVDLSPRGEPIVNGEYHVFAPSEVEQVPIWRSIYEAVAAQQPQRVVIDSVTQLRYLSTDEYQFRKHILGLVAFLSRNGCTSLLTFEPSELDRETSVALAADGVIRLRTEVSAGRVINIRSLYIEKLRGSDFASGYHPMRITGDGIVVYPHRIEPANGTLRAGQKLSSGVRQLDELLGGGLEEGTTTLLTGPSGVGKSTIGTQFLRVAAASGQRTTLFTFEESIQSILTRCRGVGIPLEPFLGKGTLKIVRVNAMELYPDEFLAMVREAVQRDGCQFVKLDSIRGYQLAPKQALGDNIDAAEPRI